MLMDWPSWWLSAQTAALSALLAFPLAFALGWSMTFDRRIALPVRLAALLPGPVLLAAWLTGAFGWMLAAAMLVSVAALAREASIRIAAVPAPWLESVRTLGAPAWRAAWPSVRSGLFAAAGWVAGRVFLEALAGLLLRGRGQ